MCERFDLTDQAIVSSVWHFPLCPVRHDSKEDKNTNMHCVVLCIREIIFHDSPSQSAYSLRHIALPSPSINASAHEIT